MVLVIFLIAVADTTGYHPVGLVRCTTKGSNGSNSIYNNQYYTEGCGGVGTSHPGMRDGTPGGSGGGGSLYSGAGAGGSANNTGTGIVLQQGHIGGIGEEPGGGGGGGGAGNFGSPHKGRGQGGTGLVINGFAYAARRGQRNRISISSTWR